MEFNTKFVEFVKYCKNCKHMETSQVDEPCNTCLEVGAREGTEVPEKFEERES